MAQVFQELLGSFGISLLCCKHLTVYHAVPVVGLALGGQRVGQHETLSAVCRKEILVAQKLRKIHQPMLAVYIPVHQPTSQIAISAYHITHGQITRRKRYIYILVARVGLLNAVVILKGLRVVLLVHIALGQYGVVSGLAGHSLGQLLQLLACPFRFVDGAPQLLLLQRHLFYYTESLLHSVQHLDGPVRIVRHQVGIRKAVVVVQLVGVGAHYALPCGGKVLVVALHHIHLRQLFLIPDALRVQLAGLLSVHQGAVKPPQTHKHSPQLVVRRRIPGILLQKRLV